MATSARHGLRAIAAGATELPAATPSRPGTLAVAEAVESDDGLTRLGEPKHRHELEAAEQKRWMTWLGPPFMIEALAVGLVFATGKPWWLALGVASVFATVLILIRLVLSSETNTLLDSSARQAGRVRPVAAAAPAAGTLP